MGAAALTYASQHTNEVNRANGKFYTLRVVVIGVFSALLVPCSRYKTNHTHTNDGARSHVICPVRFLSVSRTHWYCHWLLSVSRYLCVRRFFLCVFIYAAIYCISISMLMVRCLLETKNAKNDDASCTELYFSVLFSFLLRWCFYLASSCISCFSPAFPFKRCHCILCTTKYPYHSSALCVSCMHSLCCLKIVPSASARIPTLVQHEQFERAVKEKRKIPVSMKRKSYLWLRTTTFVDALFSSYQIHSDDHLNWMLRMCLGQIYRIRFKRMFSYAMKISELDPRRHVVWDRRHNFSHPWINILSYFQRCILEWTPERTDYGRLYKFFVWFGATYFRIPRRLRKYSKNVVVCHPLFCFRCELFLISSTCVPQFLNNRMSGIS